MQKIRPYVLPAAIVLGTLLHSYCAIFSFLVPFIIFGILLLTFCGTDLQKLRIKGLDHWIMVFQLVVSVGSYALLRVLGADKVLAESVLVGVICPVASSVAVISVALGANRETMVTYTILGNLMVSIAAPAIFSVVGPHTELGFFPSFWLILKRIAPTLALPILIAWALQTIRPKWKEAIGRHSGKAFYLWALALLFTLGQTIDYIFLKGKGHWDLIGWQAVAALFFCILQFGFGKWLGHQYGETIAGGQLLGQKNSAMGIWMANTFMTPLASVFMAFYSIYQNIFNSIQLWLHDRKKAQTK